ncbi:MAG: hypothetical protein LBR26_11580, partial [Prevotella sp.]|nr:hypothetical protein [Prevotella sp.]
GASRKIEEVSFYIPNGIDTISLTEIQLLEKNMIGIEMKIRDSCDGNKNYFMTKRYTFGDEKA